LNDFDKIAPYYDTLARLVFGNALSQAGDRYLKRIPPQSRVLIVGGGTGRLIDYLNKSAPGSYIAYVDSSSQMIKRAQLRQADQLIVEFISGSILTFHGNSFDFIVTPYLLDLFSENELDVLYEKLYGCLGSGGQWLFTDFVPGNSWRHKLLINIMYWFFGKLSNIGVSQLPDYDKWFNRYSLTLALQDMFINGLVVSRVYLKR
jgi:ubiquinone/menaquinone biosynthesis C-methylase UbiE